MSEEQAARPVLRIVHGTATPEELAVLTAVVSAASSGGGAGNGNDTGNGTGRVGRWNDPAALHRYPWRPGPGAWRNSFR